VLVCVGIALAVGRRHELGQAVHLLSHLRVGALVVALAFEVASLVAFARLQRWLLRAGGVDVGLGTMVEITVAGNALAMSLPGGAAWSAAWAYGQLRRRGADRVLAGWVVLVAGALASFVLFLLLVVGSLVAGNVGPAKSFRPVGVALAMIPFAAAAAVLLYRRFPVLGGAATRLRRLVASLPFGSKVLAFAENTIERVQTVRPSGAAWTEAFALAALNWIETCACLVACIWAVHGHVPWHGILVAYTLAQVAASIPVTPGGLGVVEGSLTALLVAYGMPETTALAAVLLFRAVSFWGLVPIGWSLWAWLSLTESRTAARGDRRPHPWSVHPEERVAAGDAR
jgi:uncharacterized protein (TIRG00374 family)